MIIEVIIGIALAIYAGHIMKKMKMVIIFTILLFVAASLGFGAFIIFGALVWLVSAILNSPRDVVSPKDVLNK